EKIEKQVDFLEKHPNKIAVCNTKHFYNNPATGMITDQAFLYSTNDGAQFLLNLWGGNERDHSMIGQHAWLTPRRIIKTAGGWNEGLLKDQDGEFFARVVMHCEGII